MQHTAEGHAAALITIVVWGSTFVVTKILLQVLGPTQILVVRFLAAGLLMVPFARGFFRWAGWRVELRWVLAGLTGITAYYLFENLALARTQATDVGLIVTIIPLLTALASGFAGERLSGRAWVGALLATAGVLAVLANGWNLGLDVAGDLAALGAAATFTLYSLIIRGLPPGSPALVTVARTFLWGALLAVPFLGFEGGWPEVQTLVAPATLGGLAFLVLAASGAAYALWNRAIRILGIVRTNNYIYVVPLVNTALGALVLGEPLTPLTLAGGALIIGGVVWAGRRS